MSKYVLAQEYKIYQALSAQGVYPVASLPQYQDYMDSLRQKGLDLACNHQQIRSRIPFVALSKRQTLGFLAQNDQFLAQHLLLIYQLDSTSDYLARMKLEKEMILVAEYQTAGRGRRGNHWLSPLGCNLYLSVRYVDVNLADMAFFPLYLALLIRQVLLAVQPEIQFKWPNDLYLKGRKFCGMMLQSVRQQGRYDLIAGIGININMPAWQHQQIDQASTNLTQAMDCGTWQKRGVAQYYPPDGRCIFNRNYLLAQLLPPLHAARDSFEPSCIDYYRQQLQQCDYLWGKELLVHEQQVYPAQYLGINADGSLRVKTNYGEKDLYAANVSIKAGN